jgi:hypothetical protein
VNVSGIGPFYLFRSPPSSCTGSAKIPATERELCGCFSLKSVRARKRLSCGGHRKYRTSKKREQWVSKRSNAPHLAVLAFFPLAGMAADVSIEQRKVPLEIPPATGEIVIDAYLDEEAWAHARRIVLPYESWPGENIPAPGVS